MLASYIKEFGFINVKEMRNQEIRDSVFLSNLPTSYFNICNYLYEIEIRRII